MISLRFQTPDLTLTLFSPDEGEEGKQVIELGEGWSLHWMEGDSGPGTIRFDPDTAWPGRPVQLAEQTLYAVQVEGRVERHRFDLRLNAQSGFFHSFSRKGATTFSGTLNWGNFVGWSRLDVVVDGRLLSSLPVEVRSIKMDYRTDFRAMLDDLTAQWAALIFNAFGPVAVPTVWREPGPRTAALDALWLRTLLAPDRLPAAFARIVGEPWREPHREYRWQDLSQVVQVGTRTVQDLVAHPEWLAPVPPCFVRPPGLPAVLGDRAPTQLRVERMESTLDAPENRLVKDLLGRLKDLATDLLRQLGGRGKETENRQLVLEFQNWIGMLEVMQQTGFLGEIGRGRGAEPPITIPPRMWRQDGYREFAQAWQGLHLIGRVVWEDFTDYLASDVRDMATLYEWWALFQLLETLRTVAGPLELQDFIEWDGEIWRIRLRPGPVARGAGWTLFYQRTFPGGRGSYSIDLRPDFTLEVDSRLFLFDAKYRAETAEEFGQPSAGERTFERGDLYKMHTYRDAIAGAVAAFVLYPGDEKRLLAADGTVGAWGPSFTGVGAWPLRPGRKEPLLECVQALLGK